MLSEKVHFAKVLAPAADRFNTNPAGDRINLRHYPRATFLVIHDGGTTGKATITVQSFAAASGGSNTDLPFTYRRMTTGDSDAVGAISAATAAGIDTVPTESTIIEIEVNANDLPEANSFVTVKLTEAVNDPVNGVVVAILDRGRYKDGSGDISALS